MIALLALSASAATLTGEILARGSGDPVADADIRVQGAEIVVHTDARGAFAVEVPDDQAVRLIIAHPQWRPAEVDSRPPHNERVRVWLDVAPTPMEIVVEAFKSTSHPTRHVIDAEIAYETPGTLDDAVRLVQSLPSVTIQREYSPSAGELSVRGSSAGDNRYYLDGVELPYLYHYNQYASVYPTSWIDQLDLYPSTFGAAYGDAVGGVVDAISKAEAPKKLHGSASWNLLMAGGDLRAPLGHGWWGSVAGRRSYLDFVSSNPQYPRWPIFSDHAARVQKDLGNGHFALFNLGASDGWDRLAGELDLMDPVEAAQTPGFAYRRGYEVLGAERRWTGEREGRLVGGLVYDRLSGELTQGGKQVERNVAVTSRLDVGRGAVEHVGYGFGYELRAEREALLVEDPGPQGILVAEEAPALGRGLAIDDALLRVRGGVYGEARLRWGGFRVFPGVRVSADSGVGALSADPRLAMRWKLAPQSELKLAGGWYHQTPDSALLLDTRAELPQSHAWQLSAGWEQTIAQRLEFTVDVWGKEIAQLVTAPIGEAPRVMPRGRGFGAETVVRYRLRERFFVWGWLGGAHTEAIDGEERFPVRGDQPLTAGLVTSWDVSERWNLGLRYRYGSGLPFTGASGSVYDAGNDAWVPVPAQENGERLPPFSKYDAHAAYKVTFPSWTATLSLEMGYVPSKYAALYPTWSYDYREQGWVRGPVFLPLISARATF